MPIEFRCSQCQKLLRTPDASIGKQARCPLCGTVQPVPDEAVREAEPFAAAPSVVSSLASSTSESSNPYQAFSNEGVLYPDAVDRAVAIRPTPVDVGDLLSITWRIFKNNFGECLLVFFVAMVIYYVVLSVLFAINFLLITPLLPRQGNLPPDIPGQLGQGLASLVAMPVWIFLFSGVQLCMLRIARGQPTSLSYLFQAGPWFLRLLVAGLLFGIAYLIGSFLIIGGVILLCFAWPFPFLILDRNQGAIESLTSAFEITEGNRLTAFLIGLLMTALSPISFVCGCGIGFFVVYLPFLQLLPAVFYLLMTGQPTAEQRYR